MSSFKKRALEWCRHCHGNEITDSLDQRNQRFLEEALELVQAAGMSRAHGHRILDFVYERPKGDLYQELGGVMVTLALFASVRYLDMDEAGEDELARCWRKIEEIRKKQGAKPKL